MLEVLTRYGCAPREGRCYPRIELDHEVPIIHDFGVSGLYLASHPVFEGVTDKGVGYINEPLLWYLFDLNRIWDVVKDNWVLITPLQDVDDGEPFILRYRKMSGLFTRYI